MVFYTLKELNIKILDFATLLSPLGVVKKISSNGERHLFEIFFHNKIKILDGELKVKQKGSNIDNTFLKLFYDSSLGFIINDSSCIIEIPNSIDPKSQETDLRIIGKQIRKNIPKDLSKILKFGFNLKKRKITNPESINILNLVGFHNVNL